jgi:hypothetical protein
VLGYERFAAHGGDWGSTVTEQLARGLNDSPAGLASWIVDKFHAWSECDGDVERSFTKDELLTNVTLYWVTGTIGSSFLPYADFVNAGTVTWAVEAFRQWIGSTDVPAAFAMFPKDISHPPREWAARFFNVQRWTEMSRGGHFAALEEPELLVDDIRRFFRPLRGVGTRHSAGRSAERSDTSGPR